MKQTNKLWMTLIVFSLLVFPALEKISYAAVQMVPENFSELARQAKPAVVNIQTEKTIEGGGRVYRHFFGSPFGGNQDMFEEFFGPFLQQQPRNRKESSLGSGFIITGDGYIVTNNHVIKDADQIKVILHDNKEYEATVVGTDPMTDLALIKIEAKDLMALKFGSSSKAEVGSWVVAIGSPFGLEQTVTAGIVSAKGRIIGSGPYDDFIQTDASINPGNSGGPLFNLKGEVVGINTAIMQGGQGIGFATPIQLAKSVLEQLKDKGKVTRGWLGVYIQKLTPEAAENLGISGKHGALVSDVTSGGPAEKAGIRSGDVIVGFNGKEIRDEHELPQAVASTKPGKTANVRMLREGKEMPVTVTIAEMTGEPGKPAGGHEIQKNLGLTVQDITPEIAQRFEIADTKGVVVTGVEDGSPAEDAGFNQGDIIRAIVRQNKRDPVTNAAEFAKLVKKFQSDKTILFLVERDEA